MARYMGKDGVVSAGGAAVGQVTEFSLSEDFQPQPADVMGQGYVGHGIGHPIRSGSIACMVDASDAGQQSLYDGATVQLTLQPEGVGSGLSQMVFSSVHISNVEQTTPVAGFATVTFDYVADSDIDRTAQT